MLRDGTLQRYIDELSITGLTSNPTIFDKAITGGDTYDEHIIELHERGLDPEGAFFELALADLRDAARLFEPVSRRTDGIDGWVSLEVSPLLADDAKATIEQVADLHGRADCYWPAPAPRTPRPPMCCTSRRSSPRTPSTPCPTRHCSPSPTTGGSGSRCRPTAATPRRSWPNSRPRAWGSPSSGRGFRARGPRHSTR